MPWVSKRMKRQTGLAVAHELLPYLVAVLTLMGTWWIVSAQLPAFIMPPLQVVLPRLVKELSSPAYLAAVGVSLQRLMVGYSAALLSGLVVGMIGSAWTPFRLYARAMISILQSVPPIAWVPLLIIVFGFGNMPIIVVIAISSFFPVALSVMDGAQLVDKKYVEAAAVMGANKWQTISTVYAPAVMPALITGAQVGFGNAWRSLIAAEMVGGVNIGLGWSITYAGEVADMSGVLAGIVTIGGLAAFLDRVVINNLKRRLVLRRWGLD